MINDAMVGSPDSTAEEQRKRKGKQAAGAWVRQS